MDASQRKEQFSYAYLLATATSAGFVLGDPKVDQDSVDTTVYASGQVGRYSSPRLDVQLKCRAEDNRSPDPLRVSISRKNYDDLRTTTPLCPIILAVLFVPSDDTLWTEHSHEQLLTRYCCYWASLRGLPEIQGGAGSTTVDVPRNQMLNVAQLQDLMTRISQRGLV